MNSNSIKEQAQKFGANLCGIAPVDRFNDAPKGFNPLDLFPQTKSVIAIAKLVPKSMLNLHTCIPYTVVEKIILDEIHRIAVEIILFIESQGFEAVIVPSEPYEYWDTETKTGKGLISLKHIAHKCGLGVFGKNHLLYNSQYGSLIKLGAVLTNAYLESDPIIQNTICKENCNLCISGCPAGAIGERSVNQTKCREFSAGNTLQGDSIYACNFCRRICPNVSGFGSNLN